MKKEIGQIKKPSIKTVVESILMDDGEWVCPQHDHHKAHPCDYDNTVLIERNYFSNSEEYTDLFYSWNNDDDEFTDVTLFRGSFVER